MSDSMAPGMANPELYARLGAVVRELHEALHALGADDVLAEAASEFPSARERLLHIGKLTEKAANTVLNKVEESSPIQEKLARNAQKLSAAWSDIPDDALPVQVKSLVGQTQELLIDTQDGCNATRENLSSMMMAQDFQDITGQLIMKVVAVLARTENDLLRLLIEASPSGAVSRVKKEEMMAGPGAPGGIALAQNDVDDLLADLGF